LNFNRLLAGLYTRLLSSLVRFPFAGHPGDDLLHEWFWGDLEVAPENTIAPEDRIVTCDGWQGSTIPGPLQIEELGILTNLS
jgi:hypothetical protein